MPRRGRPWRSGPPPGGRRRAPARPWSRRAAAPRRHPGGVDGAHPPGRPRRVPRGRVDQDDVPLGLVERRGEPRRGEPARRGGEVRLRDAGRVSAELQELVSVADLGVVVGQAFTFAVATSKSWLETWGTFAYLTVCAVLVIVMLGKLGSCIKILPRLLRR
uniref:Uncharacterized protein n=1 Tax=Setaria viridis TaxID=4556 RepID=A0A4U6V9U0_SETVI|nr:hypothetical protein SEVIR_3G099400v2 [Setaria viridis]